MKKLIVGVIWCECAAFRAEALRNKMATEAIDRGLGREGV